MVEEEGEEKESEDWQPQEKGWESEAEAWVSKEKWEKLQM